MVLGKIGQGQAKPLPFAWVDGMGIEYLHTHDDFYQSTRWKKKRQSILARDGYQCRECRRYGRMREAKEVHHIKHLDEHPERAFDDDNLISLCHRCHNAMHPEKAKGLNKSKKFRGYDP